MRWGRGEICKEDKGEGQTEICEWQRERRDGGVRWKEGK